MTARGRKLARTVYVYDPEEGRQVTFVAGDMLPGRLRSEVTNASVFDEDDDEPDGFGEVEQSGPYVGLSHGQMVAIAAARGLTVAEGADTDTVLAQVVEADTAAAGGSGRESELQAALTAASDRIAQMEAELQAAQQQLDGGAKKPAAKPAQQ